MTEKRPIISTGGRGPASGGERRRLPMVARYAIDAVLVAVVLILGELLIGGGVITRYQSTVLEQVGVYIILAVSLNIATGYLGQLPLGHAGFMSVGAYGCALFVMHMSEVLGMTARDFATGSPLAIPLVIGGLLVGGICAAVAGIIIGIPALRLKGDYLAIITLAFAEIDPRGPAQHRRRARLRAHWRRKGPHRHPRLHELPSGVWLCCGGVFPHPHDDEVAPRSRHSRYPRQ